MGHNSRMSTVKLPDEKWSKIVAFLRDCPRAYVGNPVECRRFVEGVLWVTRSGGQWRLLPAEYGKWNSVYKRFAGWCDNEVWEQMHQHFADDPDMENLIIDSTIVRAHPCSAGALKKTVGRRNKRSDGVRGGFSTKIHVSVDALGNPLRFILTAGQRHDSTQAEALTAKFEFERIIADKSYDSTDFLQQMLERGAETVIPPRRNRRVTREYDKHLYRERHLVECFINKIKQFRRVFSRFDKMAKRYLGFLSFVGALIWLR